MRKGKPMEIENGIVKQIKTSKMTVRAKILLNIFSIGVIGLLGLGTVGQVEVHACEKELVTFTENTCDMTKQDILRANEKANMHEDINKNGFSVPISTVDINKNEGEAVRYTNKLLDNFIDYQVNEYGYKGGDNLAKPMNASVSRVKLYVKSTEGVKERKNTPKRSKSTTQKADSKSDGNDDEADENSAVICKRAKIVENEIKNVEEVLYEI